MFISAIYEWRSFKIMHDCHLSSAVNLSLVADLLYLNILLPDIFLF